MASNRRDLTDVPHPGQAAQHSTPNRLPAALQSLYDNPHVLFPEPPIGLFRNRQNWIVQTTQLGDSMVEFTLTLQQPNSKVEGNVHQLEALGRLQPRPAPTVVPVIQRAGTLRAMLTLSFATLLFVLWPIREDGDAVLWNMIAGSALRGFIAFAAAGLLVGKAAVQESVSAVRGLGVQLTTVYDDGSRSSTFIDASSIRGIIVNEGMQTCDVRYYLALVVSGRNKMVLLFDHARPRLPAIAHVYRHMTRLMCDPLPASSSSSSVAGNDASSSKC